MDDIMMRLDTRLEEITKAKKEKRDAKAKAEAEAETRKVKQEAQDLENRKEIKCCLSRSGFIFFKRTFSKCFNFSK
jgi:hypothetical protein